MLGACICEYQYRYAVVYCGQITTAGAVTRAELALLPLLPLSTNFKLADGAKVIDRSLAVHSVWGSRLFCCLQDRVDACI